MVICIVFLCALRALCGKSLSFDAKKAFTTEKNRRKYSKVLWVVASATTFRVLHTWALAPEAFTI
jgi:hypothetical protein